jgi:hypothetical protein
LLLVSARSLRRPDQQLAGAFYRPRSSVSRRWAGSGPLRSCNKGETVERPATIATPALADAIAFALPVSLSAIQSASGPGRFWPQTCAGDEPARLAEGRGEGMGDIRFRGPEPFDLIARRLPSAMAENGTGGDSADIRVRVPRQLRSCSALTKSASSRRLGKAAPARGKTGEREFASLIPRRGRSRGSRAVLWLCCGDCHIIRRCMRRRDRLETTPESRRHRNLIPLPPVGSSRA